MSLTNLDNEPLYYKGVWAKYLGEDTEVFKMNHMYRGNFLIFERSTIVHVTGGSSVSVNRTYKTRTKYWKIIRRWNSHP